MGHASGEKTHEEHHQKTLEKNRFHRRCYRHLYYSTGLRYDMHMTFLGMMARAIVVGIFTLFGISVVKNPPEAKPAVRLQTPSISEQTDTLSQDTDADGLKDWEERLRGTDLGNKDSDADGTIDGKEVVLGRNPLKPGPEDRVVPAWSAMLLPPRNDPSKSTPGAPPKNAPSVETSPEISPSTAAPTQSNPTTATVKLSAEQTELKAYGNAAGKALKPFIATWREEFDTFKKVITGEYKTEGPEKLRAIAQGYHARGTALESVASPSALLTMHRELIEDYEKQAAQIEMLAGAAAVGITGEKWQTYNASVAASSKAFVAISVYLKDKKVTFSSAEDGYLFNILPF